MKQHQNLMAVYRSIKNIFLNICIQKDHRKRTPDYCDLRSDIYYYSRDLDFTNTSLSVLTVQINLCNISTHCTVCDGELLSEVDLGFQTITQSHLTQ